MHLYTTSVVEPRGMNNSPMSIRVRLSLAREGKLQWKVCLYLHLEQGGTSPVKEAKGLVATLFSLTDGSYSKFQIHTFGLCLEKLG